MYRGKTFGDAMNYCGTQVEVKDPVKLAKKSEFQDKELQNITPLTEQMQALKKVDNQARLLTGKSIA